MAEKLEEVPCWPSVKKDAEPERMSAQPPGVDKATSPSKSSVIAKCSSQISGSVPGVSTSSRDGEDAWSEMPRNQRKKEKVTNSIKLKVAGCRTSQWAVVIGRASPSGGGGGCDRKFVKKRANLPLEGSFSMKQGKSKEWESFVNNSGGERMGETAGQGGGGGRVDRSGWPHLSHPRHGQLPH